MRERLHRFGIATRDRPDDAELLLLLGPAMWQRAGERSDREIGRRAAIGNGLDGFVTLANFTSYTASWNRTHLNNFNHLTSPDHD